jgi:hypothetical protein
MPLTRFMAVTMAARASARASRAAGLPLVPQAPKSPVKGLAAKAPEPTFLQVWLILHLCSTSGDVVFALAIFCHWCYTAEVTPPKILHHL